MVKEAEGLEKKLYALQSLAPNQQSLISFSIQTIVKALPQICDDPEELWQLLLNAYGNESFTPAIVKKFPVQFSENTEAYKNSLKMTKDKF